MNKVPTFDEFVAELSVEAQHVLKGMLAKASISPRPTAAEILDKLTPLLSTLSADEQALLLDLTQYEKRRFSPKLDFVRRCQILALYRTGITREQLAQAYGVNRRTVTHIYNQNSPHYKDVRMEEQALGADAFRSKYMSQQVVERALSFRQIKEAMREKNNKLANRRAGMHIVRGSLCELEHRVVIAWKEENEPLNTVDYCEIAGWYYNDLDGDFPGSWIYVNDKSRSTSDSCYAAMLKDITDKE